MRHGKSEDDKKSPDNNRALARMIVQDLPDNCCQAEA